MGTVKLFYIISVCLSFFFFRKEPEYITLSDKILLPELARIKKEKGYLYAGGGGSFYSNVKSIALTFTINQSPSLPEARKIYTELVEAIVEKYNANEKIRPYLDNYPFLPKNVEILLLFKLSDLNKHEPTVGSINMIRGNLRIALVCPETGQEIYRLTEPYDETYRLVYGHERDNSKTSK